MINFSVIIPLYNKSETILDTVNSVLNQTYPHFELIIVNDGSTDDSLEKVKSISDKRIRIIDKENTGVSDTRNVGINEAKYDWIALLDGDDLKHKDFLIECKNAIDKYPTKKIFSTGYSEETNNEQKKYWNKFLPLDGETGIVDYIDCMPTGEPPINSSNSVIHKSMFQEFGGFIKNHKNYEDHELWLRMYLPDSIVFINKSLTTLQRNLGANHASLNKAGTFDMGNYFRTMGVQIKKNKNMQGRKLQKFANIFCLWFFLKRRTQYTRKEQKELLISMKEASNGVFKLLLDISYLLKLSR